jgi:hypothetical protein
VVDEVLMSFSGSKFCVIAPGRVVSDELLEGRDEESGDEHGKKASLAEMKGRSFLRNKIRSIAHKTLTAS